MLNHLVAKDLVVDTADLHVMVDLLMELFQLYDDRNLDDSEGLEFKIMNMNKSITKNKYQYCTIRN